MDLKIDHIGGFCPVQAEGTIDGIPFYFRSRGERWAIGIGEDPVDILLGWKEGWRRSQAYGNARFAAGYMPIDEAEDIIRRCAEEFVLQRNVAQNDQ